MAGVGAGLKVKEEEEQSERGVEKKTKKYCFVAYMDHHVLSKRQTNLGLTS